MKRRGVFPHTITVEHRTVTGTDDRNNDVRTVTSTVDGLPANVHPSSAVGLSQEDTENRERDTSLLEIEALPYWHGANVEIPAEDTIIWEGRTYEVLGAADIETDHLGRRDHLHFTARRIVG